MNFSFFSNDIAIDLGTVNTRIYVKGKGIVLDEPTVVAYDVNSGDIVAVGQKAYEMLGRTPAAIEAVCPLENGVISNYVLTEALIKEFLKKVCPKSIVKPRMMMSVPCGVTDVEKRALRDAAAMAGARKIYIMETPIAAALGANCDVSPARGMMIIDMGGGKCDIATISLGQAVVKNSFKIAGNSFTEAIIAYIRQRYNVAVGFITADRIKTEIGCVASKDKTESVSVSGLNVTTSLPETVVITSDDIKEALSDCMEDITMAVKQALDDTPPELLADILEDGILLTGGLAKLDGMVRRLRIDTGLMVYLAPDSDYCVVRGLSLALDSIDNLSEDAYIFYKG